MCPRFGPHRCVHFVQRFRGRHSIEVGARCRELRTVFVVFGSGGGGGENGGTAATSPGAPEEAGAVASIVVVDDVVVHPAMLSVKAAAKVVEERHGCCYCINCAKRETTATTVSSVRRYSRSTAQK